MFEQLSPRQQRKQPLLACAQQPSVSNPRIVRIKPLLVVSALLMLLMSCAMVEPKATTEEPLNYALDGIEFQMPGNWKAYDGQTAAGYRKITIKSRADLVITVVETPVESVLPLQQKVEQDIEKYQQDKVFGRVSDNVFEAIALSGTEGDLEGIRRRFNFLFMGKSVEQVSDNYSVQYADATLYLYSLAFSHDLPKVQAGIDQVFSTIRR